MMKRKIEVTCKDRTYKYGLHVQVVSMEIIYEAVVPIHKIYDSWLLPQQVCLWGISGKDSAQRLGFFVSVAYRAANWTLPPTLQIENESDWVAWHEGHIRQQHCSIGRSRFSNSEVGRISYILLINSSRCSCVTLPKSTSVSVLDEEKPEPPGPRIVYTPTGYREVTQNGQKYARFSLREIS